MAIVKMKKLFLVGPMSYQDVCVHELERLGVVHVEDLAEEFKEPPAELAGEMARAKRVVDHLKRIRAGMENPSRLRDQGDTAELLSAYEKLVASRQSAEQELSSLHKDKQALLPWGDFEKADLDLLATKGVTTRFLVTSDKEFREAETAWLDDALWSAEVELKGAKNKGLIVIFMGELPENPFDELALPERSLSTIARHEKKYEDRLAEIASKLEELSAYLPLFEAYCTQAEAKYNRARVVGGMLEEGPFFAVGGWTPSAVVSKIEHYFRDIPVVVHAEDPVYGEDVPIKFKNNIVVSWFEPLISMFKLPSYWEPDPTLMVAPFLAIFFGFCFGDAAYGVVLLALASFGASKMKGNRMGMGFMRMLQILGFSTFVIGALMGSFFGMQLTNFAWAAQLKQFFPIASFTKNSGYNDFLLFSIKLGILQLMVGQVVAIVLAASRKEIQTMIGKFGWLGASAWFYVLIFNAWPDKMDLPFWILGGASGGLILFFSSTNRNPLKRVGAGLWELYGVTGLGGDIVSYARIFGLGLSSGIIAATVNAMALDVGGAMPRWIGWLPMAAILIFGHVFNLAMAAIGSLVHSARLNFLEFYGKFFDGGGRPFTPFGKQ